MKKLMFFAVCLLAIASCNNGNKKETEMALRVDSLNQVIAQKDSEIDDMMSTFGEIETGFREIAEAQERVSVAKSGEGASAKERIRENLQFIQNTMKQNKELINKLKQQLRQSNMKGDALRKLVDSMQQQLEEKEQQLQQMRAALDEKDIQIMNLDEKVSSLSSNVEELTTETKQRAETIADQDKQLNTAWFVFGTKSELKEQQILVDGKVLQSSFNKEYFTKIDIRVDKEIKLYSSSAQILTTHPSGAYTLQRDANKQYVLRITNPQKFWATSKYLVILVK